jgi:hypothetical protein
MNTAQALFVTYPEFMDQSEWTDTDDGSTRTAINGIVVEIIKIGEHRYQPVANGPHRYSSFGKACRCDTLNDAKCYAWVCFKHLFDLPISRAEKQISELQMAKH